MQQTKRSDDFNRRRECAPRACILFCFFFYVNIYDAMNNVAKENFPDGHTDIRFWLPQIHVKKKRFYCLATCMTMGKRINETNKINANRWLGSRGRRCRRGSWCRCIYPPPIEINDRYVHWDDERWTTILRRPFQNLYTMWIILYSNIGPDKKLRNLTSSSSTFKIFYFESQINRLTSSAHTDTAATGIVHAERASIHRHGHFRLIWKGQKYEHVKSRLI